MTAFSDFRQNPWDSTFSDRVMDPEIHVVAEFDNLPGIYGIALQDRPVSGTVTIVTNDTAATAYTEVTTTPLAGQFRVDYVRGLIQFNSADDGDSVEVNYSGRGSNVSIALIEALIGTIASTFTTITATLAAGLNFVSENATAVARFGAGNTSLAEFFGNVNIGGNSVTAGHSTVTGNATSTGSTRFGDGSVSAPGSAFKDETGTGKYRIAAGREGISVLGAKVGEYNANGFQGLDNYVLIVDEKTANTAGGTFTSGAWQTRELNTVRTNRIAGVSLSSNQITLPAGTYKVKAMVPSYRCDAAKAKLRQTSGTPADLLIGTSEHDGSTTESGSKSIIAGEFTLASPETIEIQHRCATTRSADGFGVPSNFGVVEVYTQVEIWRIA